MPKLVIYTQSDIEFASGQPASFVCGPEDERLFAGHVGAPIIVGNTGFGSDRGYVALGKFSGFAGGDDDGKRVVVNDLLAFPYPLPFLEGFPPEIGLAEISDEVFARIIDQSQGYSAEEAPAAAFDTFGYLTYEFTRQLENQREKRCSFSDVSTDRGAARMIRPIEHGGNFHISNFLFLDPEPGALFADFAWTVGPQFQIIIDAQATGADVASTVNATGMLALGDDVSRWPDRSALAWHFQQFLRRRGG